MILSPHRSLLILLLFLIGGWRDAAATVRVAIEDGMWDAIAWSPSGAPGAGDTVIIASDVRGMPERAFGKLIVKPHGRLRLEIGEPSAHGVLNQGTIELARGSALEVVGNLVNEGTIAGDGVVRMTRGESIIAGRGAHGNLIVGGAPGTRIYLADDLTIRSLTLAAGATLISGDNDLTVNGPYRSLSAFGAPGIEGVSGTIRLNGSVDGTARGRVVIGNDPAARRSKRAAPPEVHGALGHEGGSVRFMASRRLSFSTLMGDVVIDSGATVEAGGIGASGGSRFVGALTVRGTLTGGEEGRTWTIEGELSNHGRIESCTLAMSGRGARRGARLACDSGEWDPGISLTFTGESGSELAIDGPLVVSRLTIAPRTPLDSDVVVNAGSSPIRIRHGFTSDGSRGCRLRSDTTVSVWGSASGVIEGPVTFEGFWGSPVAGVYGAPGRTVRFAAWKSFDGPVAIRGSLRLERSPRGEGSMAITAAASALDFTVPLGDSVTLEIGSDSAITSASLLRALHAARLVIHPGSALAPGGVELDVRELRYGIRFAAGYTAASIAVDGPDHHTTLFFPGATSALRYEDGYHAADTVAPGVGYYVRYPRDTIIWQSGRAISIPLTIPLHAGWNLIGGVSAPIDVDRIAIGGATLLSGFLRSLGGAESVDVIEPGHGYWVNVEGEGILRVGGGR